MLYELHCHSTSSDGTASPAEIVAHAKSFLDGIAITDHDEIEGSLEAMKYGGDGFTVIPGIEVSASEGHILALNVREKIERDLTAKETVERIHSLGGLAIAAHPYDTYRRGVGDLILKVGFDAVEVVNGHTFGNIKDPRSICRENGLAMVGGSDAHSLEEIGSVKVGFEGEFRNALVSGGVSIFSKPRLQLLVNHGLGVVRRRGLRKIVEKRLNRRGV